jgi:hypothetical protein
MEIFIPVFGLVISTAPVEAVRNGREFLALAQRLSRAPLHAQNGGRRRRQSQQWPIFLLVGDDSWRSLN